LTIGVLLNTKGLVELIVLNIGLDVGILTNEIFTGFVLMALFNTFITTPLVWFIWTRHTANAAPVPGKKCVS
jgi:Kef-type K+ transport system membrane component KefB